MIKIWLHSVQEVFCQSCEIWTPEPRWDWCSVRAFWCFQLFCCPAKGRNTAPHPALGCGAVNTIFNCFAAANQHNLFWSWGFHNSSLSYPWSQGLKLKGRKISQFNKYFYLLCIWLCSKTWKCIGETEWMFYRWYCASGRIKIHIQILWCQAHVFLVIANWMKSVILKIFASYFQNLFLSQGYKYIPLHVEAFLLPFISLTPVMVNFMSYCFWCFCEDIFDEIDI